MMMRQKLSYLFFFLFLTAQFYSLVHRAEHGFARHEHNGHVCEFYLHGENASHADTPATPVLASPVTIAFETVTEPQPVSSSIFYLVASPRAPPHFS